jgi:hypothetical protein
VVTFSHSQARKYGTRHFMTKTNFQLKTSAVERDQLTNQDAAYPVFKQVETRSMLKWNCFQKTEMGYIGLNE